MEKRLILFAVIAFLILLGSQYLMPKKPQPAPASPASAVETPTDPVAAGVAPAPFPAVGDANAAPVLTDAQSSPAPEDTQAAARKIVIDGDLYTAVLDNRGGVLTSWELKDYKTTRTDDAPERAFDMIAGVWRKDTMYLGSLILSDPSSPGGENVAGNNEYYQVSIEGADGQALEKLSPPAVVRLTLRRGDLQIEKVWSFDRDNYTANLSVSGTKAGKPLDGRLFLGEDIGPASEHFTSNAAILTAIYSLGDGKVDRAKPGSPDELKRISGDVRWAGLDMQYFSLIAIPRQPVHYFNTQTVKLQETGINGKTDERELMKVSLPLNPLGGNDYQLYLGPKKQENLKQVGTTDLSGVIDYGWFSFFVYPLLFVLRWIHQFVQNYGVSIILITFALSLVLFPLRFKSMLSMKKMSTVQPKVKAIQDKYRQYKATDPRKREMNQEVMALYKEHGVNPMGGCLPMLVQMPLLIAFYQMLAHTIDLRQAPFIWWMQDLSAKDPYCILPILMGITMFLSQKMAPMAPSTDPAQAKMMMFLPLIFIFMFWKLSSGLNLYFLCSNIFAIVFQKVSERWIPKEAPVPAKGHR